MTPPVGIDEIRAVYGDIEVVAGRVVAPQWWEQENMVIVTDFPLVEPRRLYVHKLIAAPLRAALALCEAIGGYELRTIGCFNPRPKRSDPNQLSLHSFGIAADLNAATNPPLVGCPPDDPRRKFDSGTFDMPEAWVNAFRSLGWTWGGDFEGRYFDPMHLQYASGA
jgi:hypothetical protein